MDKAIKLLEGSGLNRLGDMKEYLIQRGYSGNDAWAAVMKYCEKHVAPNYDENGCLNEIDRHSYKPE